AYYQGLKNTYMYNGLGLDSQAASNLAAANLITGDQGLQYNGYSGIANDQLIDPATGKFVGGGTLKYNEDWNDYLFGIGLFTQTTLSLSGGRPTSSHDFSVGYEENEGYIENN